MILHVTFQYLAEVCAPRRRTYEHRLFSADMTVEVAEGSLSDMPVAFRFDVPDFHPVPDMNHEVRWDGESLWEAYETYEYGGLTDKARRDRRDAAWLEGALDHRAVRRRMVGGDPLRLWIPGGVSSDGRYPYIEADPTVRHVRSTGIEKRRAEVLAAAGNLMVADGGLYRRAFEPVHQLKWGGPYKERHRTVAVIQPSRHDGVENEVWRADEAALMAASNRMDPDHAASLVEVLIPEACRAPLAQSALASAAALAASALRSETAAAGVAGPLADEARAVMDAVKAGVTPDAAALAGLLAEARPLLDTLPPDLFEVARNVDVALRRHDEASLAFDLDMPMP